MARIDPDFASHRVVIQHAEVFDGRTPVDCGASGPPCPAASEWAYVNCPRCLALMTHARRAARRADACFGWCEAIFPRRVASEEIGDALEDIARWQNDPACRHVTAKIAVKIVTTIVVLALNAVRYGVSCWMGKKAE